MKAIKLITTLFSLLFLLTITGCLPDSMSKWEENPPTKADAPVITVAPPANYSYSDGLSGQTKLVLDKNIAMTSSLAPNDSFTGENVTFTVSPALPAGLSLASTTGIISGTPTVVSWETEYTFTATNTGGSVETTFFIEVRSPEILTSLTYVDQQNGEDVTKDVNYRQIDKWMRFDPVTSSPATTWDISVKLDPADPYVDSGDAAEAADYPSNCYGKIKVVRGLCFDQLTGSIMGMPRDPITIPFEVVVTASKTIPTPSSVTKALKLSFLTAPAGLSYSQSSLMELSTSSTASLSSGNYVKLTDKKGTATTADDTCTFAQVEGVLNSTTVLIKKHDSTATLSNRFIIAASGTGLTTPTSTACNANSNVDMTVPVARNYSIYQTSNVFDLNKDFVLTASLLAGEEVTYAISPVLSVDKLNNPSFDNESGELKASLKDTFTVTSYTVTATNKVGSVETTIIIAPVKLPPENLSYSSQVLLMVRDASAFNIGDWASTPDDKDLNPGGGYGRIINKYYDAKTQTSALVIDIEQGSFVQDTVVDNHFPFHAEETNIGGYVALEVSSTSNFLVGEFISNENVGFGKIRAVRAPYIYVSVFNGVFFAGDTIKNSDLDGTNPGATPTTTTVIDVKDDKLIQGHTAIITSLQNTTDHTAVTLLKDGDIYTSGSAQAVVTLAEYVPVVALTLVTPADIDRFSIGQVVTQTNGGNTIGGEVYALDDVNSRVFVRHIDHDLDEDGTEVSIVDTIDISIEELGLPVNIDISDVNYGQRLFIRSFKGSFSYNTASTASGIQMIESRHYLSSITTNASPVVVRAGSTVATLNTAGTATGMSLGRAIYKDTIINKMYFSVDKGNLLPQHEFDSKNPIVLARAAYPELDNPSTTQNIILRRGIPITFHRELKRPVTATYKITPALPKGLALNTATGNISGTPAESSPFKAYTVTATVKLGTISTSTSTVFNLKVEEFFEVQLDNPEGSYILHRTGKNSGPRACRVYQSQLDAGDNEEIDVSCFLEAGELDLYMLGLKFKMASGPGMCNHMRVQPFSYYTKPYRGQSSPSFMKYYEVSRNLNCQIVQDTDGDGHIDYLIDSEGGTQGWCIGPGVKSPTKTAAFTDGDGDNDCMTEYTPGTIVNYGVNLATEMERPTWISDNTLMCLSNHNDDFKCDAGKIAMKTLNFNSIPAGTVVMGVTIPYCDVPTIVTTDLDCGGKRSNCVAGGVKGSKISDDAIDKGINSLIQAANINAVSELEYPTIVPINELIGTSQYLANYSIDHPYFGTATREADYYFDINSYFALFAGGTLGYGDPMSGMSPAYTFECLDQSYNPKSRINIMVRDWDTAFDINSPIDQNHQRKQLAQTITAQAGNVLTLNSTPDTSKIREGSMIRLGDAANGRQFYIVDSVDTGTNEVTLTQTPIRDYFAAGATSIFYTPFTGTDEYGRLIETMDTGAMTDPVFYETFNRRWDFDDPRQPINVATTQNISYLDRHEYLTTTLVRDMLNGANVEFVRFDEGGDAISASAVFGPVAVSGNTVTLGAAVTQKYYPNLHYLRKVNGGDGSEDIYFTINIVNNGATTVTAYPITRPFYGEKKK